MYSSIKPFANIPMQIRPYIKRTSTGDIEYGELINVLCYPVKETKLVRNYLGTEVVSNTQLYIDGSISVNKLDSIVFDGEERPIYSIDEYYRDGFKDIKVVYL